MAYDMKVVDTQNNIIFDARREGIKGTAQPAPLPFAPTGEPLQRKNVSPDTNTPVLYTVKFIDDAGKAYSKNEVVWKLDGEPVELTKMTIQFDIIEYRPLEDYTDKFRIDDYQELFPNDNPSKKKNITDHERRRAESTSVHSMRRLWDKLHSESVVAVGEFNSSTGGTRAGLAFIRAITKVVVKEDGAMVEQWGLELGVCKEEKIFKHMQQGELETVQEEPVGVPKRIKSNLLRR